MEHGKSTARVLSAAKELDLSVKILEMPSSTRTANDAAQACGCIAAQIIKSIIVINTDTNALTLFLVSGSNNIDLIKTSNALSANLTMAKPSDEKIGLVLQLAGFHPSDIYLSLKHILTRLCCSIMRSGLLLENQIRFLNATLMS